jgi:hypothetical protein
MPDSVSVTDRGVTITTNTASEGDLRAEMEAPGSSGTPGTPSETSESLKETSESLKETPAPPRNEKGRFVPKTGEVPAAAPEAPDAAPPADPAAPARRRDDTLPRHNPIARLNQALAQKAEADRRAAALEQELARYRQPGVTGQVTPKVVEPPPAGIPGGGTGYPGYPIPTLGQASQPEPQFEQFADAPDPYTAYLQAWTRWDRAEGIAQALAAREAQYAEQARTQTFQARLADGKTQYPDFDQVLTEADTLGLQVSAVMREAIAASPKAADLVYFLATHPEECTQLAEESVGTPVAAATVMRRLLESHLAPRAAPVTGSGPAARAPVSTAKPPVTPVGSSPVVSDAPPGDEASAAEHARYWNRRLKVPGTR